MISQPQAQQYIVTKIPELESSILALGGTAGIYKVMQVLLVDTSNALSQNDYTRILRCFELVEVLYAAGDNIIRGAVENVYIYGLGRILLSCNCDKDAVGASLPKSLYSLYVAQMVRSNI